jgi:hypothetical protein
LAKKSNDGGLLERFLIIMFGAAIVLLGAYPLTREYGGIRNYLSSKGSQLASYFERTGDSTTRYPTTGRGRLSDNLPPAQRKRLPGQQQNTKNSSNEKPMDDLTVDDRKELDSLLQSLLN